MPSVPGVSGNCCREDGASATHGFTSRLTTLYEQLNKASFVAALVDGQEANIELANELQQAGAGTGLSHRY